jgi:hypothetical protein
MLRCPEPPLDPPELSYAEERAVERAEKSILAEILEDPLGDERFMEWLLDQVRIERLVNEYFGSEAADERVMRYANALMEDDREYDPGD